MVSRCYFEISGGGRGGGCLFLFYNEELLSIDKVRVWVRSSDLMYTCFIRPGYAP